MIFIFIPKKNKKEDYVRQEFLQDLLLEEKIKYYVYYITDFIFDDEFDEQAEIEGNEEQVATLCNLCNIECKIKSCS